MKLIYSSQSRKNQKRWICRVTLHSQQFLSKQIHVDNNYSNTHHSPRCNAGVAYTPVVTSTLLECRESSRDDDVSRYSRM